MAGATSIAPDAAAFNEGEVARVEVFEETPDIRKEAFVREEVRVRKEVDRQTVDAEDTIRRERLDINTQGNPLVEGPDGRDVVDEADRRDVIDRPDRRDRI
jgi:stress response protein YsnF